MSLRRVDGFKRYAVALQYHGSSFLGFSYQKGQEDRILPDGTDLRGFRSVEGRIREALTDLFDENWENIQVSSRTDRGVHALKNTFHVDIQSENTTEERILHKLRAGMNFYLTQQTTSWSDTNSPTPKKRKRSWRTTHAVFEEDDWRRHSISDEIRVLAAKKSPEKMDNPYSKIDTSQSAEVDWNARFSATQRKYVYRILDYCPINGEWGVPFEWDRSWRIRGHEPMDVSAMRQAASILQGTHDFSSFRAARCQRNSPVVTMESILVHSAPYGWPAQFIHSDSNEAFTAEAGDVVSPTLITIQIVGSAFLYHQVRNMVSCLVDAGRRNLTPDHVRDMLHARDRSQGPSGMAPAQGLFLADVRHGDFDL